MKLFHKIKRFVSIPGFEKLLLIKGFFIFIIFSLIVFFFPLKTYLWLIKSTKKNAIKAIDPNFLHIIIRKTIKRVENAFPWKSTCLIRALTAKYLYRPFGIDSNINFMLCVKDNEIKYAHAFLSIDNYETISSINGNLKHVKF